jgi:hypothetical protein
MEYSLHRQLKEHYARRGAKFEVPVGRYRIDVVNGRKLIEIQHGSLAAIRDKIRALVAEHDVLVVKPLVMRKRLIGLSGPAGRVVSERWSPKRGRFADLFHELLYFTRAFPHKRLTIEVPLVEIEEVRYPGHGRRRRWRRNDFQVEDQRLVQVVESRRLHIPDDLWRLLPSRIRTPFDTSQLSKSADVPRWIAQRIAYCLREMGAVDVVGKKGNAWLYRAKRSSIAA